MSADLVACSRFLKNLQLGCFSLGCKSVACHFLSVNRVFLFVGLFVCCCRRIQSLLHSLLSELREGILQWVAGKRGHSETKRSACSLRCRYLNAAAAAVLVSFHVGALCFILFSWYYRLPSPSFSFLLSISCSLSLSLSIVTSNLDSLYFYRQSCRSVFSSGKPFFFPAWKVEDGMGNVHHRRCQFARAEVDGDFALRRRWQQCWWDLS